MKLSISAESTVDLTKEQLARFDIRTVSYAVTLDNAVKFDGEITNEEIVSFVNANKVLPKTSAVNEFQFDEHFDNLLKDYDAIIHFSLSSELSSAYNNARRSASNRKNVFVVDSRSLSTGIGLLAIYARRLADIGLSVEEILEKVLKRVPFVQVSSVLSRVDYLYIGGRCGMLALLGANLLRIRPQIIIKDGKIFSGKKYRGKFGKVVDRYCRDTLEQFDNPDLSLAVVAYTTPCPDIVDNAVKLLKERGFEEILVTQAGATVMSHCGEDCVGIYYINDGNSIK